jgi:hypothetical protein
MPKRRLDFPLCLADEGFLVRKSLGRHELHPRPPIDDVAALFASTLGGRSLSGPSGRLWVPLTKKTSGALRPLHGPQDPFAADQ